MSTDMSWDEKYKLMWDERYNEQGHAYGTAPNFFFKEWLLKFKPGSILMPGDGEGRNGVFAAKSGWKVISSDLSGEGKIKALELAKENNVWIDYVVGDLEKLTFKQESFDAIALIYAHFSPEKKSVIHKKLDKYLKPGGVVILEGFSKEHIHFNKDNPEVGGPQDIEMLFSTEEIMDDFHNYDITLLEESEIILEEGRYHIGKGSVIRFVATKPI